MRQQRLPFVAIVAAAIFGGSTIPAPAITVNDIDISEPGSVVNGRSIGEIGANWWKYVLETPIPRNPAHGARYRPGPLAEEGTSFLYGFPPGGPSVGTLSARVRAGDALLLPLRPWVNLKTDPAETPQVLFDQLEPLVGTIRNLAVEINGVDFATETGLDLIGSFRERFPSQRRDTTFGITMPEKNAYAGLNGFSTDLMVSEGHWMVLNLPLGHHRIVASWDAVDESGSIVQSVAVTQEVSAVPIPAPLALILGGLAALVGIGGWRSRPSTTSAPSARLGA